MPNSNAWGWDYRQFYFACKQELLSYSIPERVWLEVHTYTQLVQCTPKSAEDGVEGSVVDIMLTLLQKNKKHC